jgi:RND family efflux transporter MFP subunit
VSAESELTNTINNLEAAKNELIIKKSGNSRQDIETQQAIVRGAEARVRLQRWQYQKTLITAPFAGIVAKIDARLQETVAANKEVVSVIGSGSFAIEAFIPEADISKVKTGDIAEVTLDAYQKDAIFSARVATIDTIETIIEGVTTYKVKLVFENEDSRIRSGMTANINIIGESKSDAIVVPERAIKRSGKGKIVRVVKEGGVIEERSVETGIRGANGQTEVITGLSEGEIVVIGSK